MNTSTFGFGEKNDLEPSEYTNLFGDPFWGQAGNSRARSIYKQLSEREKALMLKANYLKMIEKARDRNFNMAADCLQWWLDGTGFTKTIDFRWLRRNNEVIVAESTNIERFEDRLKLKNYDKILIKDGDYREYSNELQRQFTGGIFRELYYVSGTSTITSKANFIITRVKGNLILSGSITHKWWDKYDWHKGANAYIPSFGYVNDSDALLVEKYCGARPYKMRGDWKQNFNKMVQIGLLGEINYKLR